ncbi:MAG: MATE family efflux transporter [Bacteroidales bacterium]|nr:MATE family efflux transporter [Bacteroidales bacterium]
MKQVSFYKQNLSLAIPIMLSSLGQSLVQMVDTLMVGKLGTIELAGISFAGSITYNALVVGMGIAMALTPLVGQAYATNNRKRISKLFENSLSLNFMISLILVSILLCLMPLLKYFGQQDSVIQTCKPYYLIVTLSFIPMMIFLSFKQFMEGIDNTKIAMIITLCANILNIILNYVFIFGKLSFPQMGLFGAGLSTFISRALMPISFYIYIMYTEKYKTYIKDFSFRNLSTYLHKILLKMGLPIAGQMFVEMFSLLGITIMMGWLSASHLAGFQIISTMVNTTFLAASGICAATTVLISHSYGNKDVKSMKKHFFSGWKMVLVIMGVFAIVFIFFGKSIASLFSNDDYVISIAAQFFIVAGVFQLLDGTQVSGLAGLRAINDVTKPFFYACFSYSLALVSAYFFGFVLQIGAWSIFAGFLIGLLCAGILYHRRFFLSVKRLS